MKTNVGRFSHFFGDLQEYGWRMPEAVTRDWQILRSNGVCFQTLEFGFCTQGPVAAAQPAAAGTSRPSAYDQTSVPAVTRCSFKHHMTPMTLQYFFNVMVKCKPHELPSMLRSTKSKLSRLMTFFFAHCDSFVSGNETTFALQMVSDIVNFMKGEV